MTNRYQITLQPLAGWQRWLLPLFLLLLGGQTHSSQSGLPTAHGPLPRVTPVDNLIVSTATYLGDNEADQITSVDVARDGTVVVGGSFPSYTPTGITPVILANGSTGAVLRLDRTGQTVLAMARRGAQVHDLALDREDRLAVCGDFGVALLNADSLTLQWGVAPGTATRCAIGDDGTIAALVGSELYLYTKDGNPIGEWRVEGSAQTDVAVDGTHELVIVTGYKQLTSNLQVAFIRAWRYDGSLAWKSYDYEQVSGLGADTRGERVAIGRDGLLYFGGTINGGTGASIFARDPKELAQSAADRTVKTDRFTDPFNVGSIKMTWLGRYDPENGALLLGQSLLTRLSNGRLYVAGNKAADLERRTDRQINDRPVGNYASGEGYLLVLSPDFTERLLWTPFARAGHTAGDSPAVGVSVQNGVAAVVLTQSNTDPERRLITSANSLLAEPPGGASDGYVAVWPALDALTAPASVAINPTVGFVGDHTFTATVLPTTATVPLTYTWSLNGEVVQRTASSNLRSDTWQQTWTTPSTAQMLQITVHNCAGEVAFSQTFAVIVAERTFMPFIRR